MIFIILILGLAIRLISLNQSFWLDETTSALVSKMALPEIFSNFAPGDFHPPLYYLILKYWGSIAGYSEVSLRIPSVIFGVLSIYIIYLLGRELINKNAGILSGGLLATSGLAVYYSQEARMYSLATFLVILLVFSFVKTFKHDGVGNWVLFSLLLAVVGFTDYVALLIFPVFWIFGIFSKQNKSWWKKFVMSHIILLILFVLWSPIFFKQLSGGILAGATSPLWYQILGQTSFKNLILIPIKFLIGRISFDNRLLYGFIVAISGLMFTYLLIKAKNAPKILWFWLIFPIVLGVILSFKIPTLSYFRFLFCLPAFYLLVSVGVEKMGKYKSIITIAILLFNLLTSFYYLFNPRFHREDWRSVAFAIDSQKIIFPSDSQKEALSYYGKGDQIVKLSDLTKADRSVWLSRYVWEVFDPEDSTRLSLEKLGYNKTQEFNFNGVVLWKYENRN